MNDAAIKNFCISARRELCDEVKARLMEWDITENADPNQNVIGETPLSLTQITQRKALLSLYKAEGEEQLIERAAYTWFNRLMAVRYMEVNDYLPCHCRMLSAADGSFDPQIVKDALAVEVEGADKSEILKLLQANDDEALFRYLFLAVCNDLAACMPDVFEPIGSAMELLLPKGMLRKDSVAARMVTDIPEEDWREGVQIVGWMYQYYVSERKDEVFASFKKGKKAERYDIAPATQLFTPDWIVKYLVQNSLGRLWMLNNPQSTLADNMEYYIAPGDDAETEFLRVSSPEELTTCDPACGSGHILVYAFDLLALIYEEAGYSRRDIPRTILENNLAGFEIDPRAVAIASFCLTMKGLEYDSRFLCRGVRPRINLLESIEFTEEEIESVPALADNPALTDALTHLSECGTLFKPTSEDFNTIDTALVQLSTANNLFADSLVGKLDQAATACANLNETYAVVVANPPYMGGKNMNKWLSDWIKKNYADAKSDLFSCFIVRNLDLAVLGAQLGFMTPYVWMFIGTYEKLRHKLIEEATITSLVQLEYSGFAGATVPICTFTLQKGKVPDYEGGYVRLSDFVGAANQAPKTLEAIANPDRGWFYRRSAETFKSIPGTPIAYWASDAIRSAFENGRHLADIAEPRQGLATSDNNRFLRKWWEVARPRINRDARSREEAQESNSTWFPIIRGGGFRKWWAITEEIVDWHNDGAEMKEAVLRKYPYLNTPDFVIKNQKTYFNEAVTWSKISSADISFRYAPAGMLFEVAGACMFANGEQLKYLQALCNSSVMFDIASMLSPTLNFEVGQIATYPVLESDADRSVINKLVEQSRNISKADWDSSETSWDFKRHSLLGER